MSWNVGRRSLDWGIGYAGIVFPHFHVMLVCRRFGKRMGCSAPNRAQVCLPMPLPSSPSFLQCRNVNTTILGRGFASSPLSCLGKVCQVVCPFLSSLHCPRINVKGKVQGSPLFLETRGTMPLGMSINLVCSICKFQLELESWGKGEGEGEWLRFSSPLPLKSCPAHLGAFPGMVGRSCPCFSVNWVWRLSNGKRGAWDLGGVRRFPFVRLGGWAPSPCSSWASPGSTACLSLPSPPGLPSLLLHRRTHQVCLPLPHPACHQQIGI